MECKSMQSARDTELQRCCTHAHPRASLISARPQTARAPLIRPAHRTLEPTLRAEGQGLRVSHRPPQMLFCEATSIDRLSIALSVLQTKRIIQLLCEKSELLNTMCRCVNCMHSCCFPTLSNWVSSFSTSQSSLLSCLRNRFSIFLAHPEHEKYQNMI